MPCSAAAATVTVNPGDSIQAAIDGASAGDTIVVNSGTYSEYFTVDKTLTMSGSGWPVIDETGLGMHHVVSISAANVHFEGFDVRNSNGFSGIHVAAANAEIVNNRITNDAYGIYLDSASGATISGNEVTHNLGEGLYIQNSDNNLISGNNVSSNNVSGYAIYLLMSDGNTITGNTVLDNRVGILVASSADNVFSQNTIRANGIGSSGMGIWLDSAQNTTLRQNTIDGNYDNLYLDGSGGTTANVVYLNSFLNHIHADVDISASTTSWNSPSQLAYTYHGAPYTSFLGNYWDSYGGADTNGDGVGEAAFSLPSANSDLYPLIEGWASYTLGTPPPDSTPPGYVTGLANTTYLPTSITWTWTDPGDGDFAKVMVYLDNAFRANVTAGTQAFTASSLSASTAYTLSTRTVDTHENVNATWVNDTATTAAADLTPPAGITGLANTTYLPSLITWTWTDPGDGDFARVMVYLDGAFSANVTAGVQSFTAPGLTPDTLHAIGTRTVDASGNVNASWVNATARTSPFDPDPPQSVSALHAAAAGGSSIAWVWSDPPDADFATVKVYVNGAFKGNITKGTETYVARNLRSLSSYTIGTRTVDTSGNVNASWVNCTTRTDAVTVSDTGSDNPLPTPTAVTGLPTATPVMLDATPTPAGLPDLYIVVGATSYAPYKEWHGAYYFEDPTVLVISYGIINRGTAASNATESSVSINDVVFDTAPVPPLAPGESVTISLKNWTPDANKNRVVIHNDPGDLVRESEEFNYHTYNWNLCLDGKRNGQETGVDCGGDYCYPCSLCDPATPLPERFDWRDFNYMTWVRDQGSCGACWAFASVGAMEGVYSKEQRIHAMNMQLNLAEADLILCSGAGSCDGGSPWDASDYIRDHGIVNETCLPYVGGMTCDDKCTDSYLWRISQIRGVVNDIDERKRAVACRGPLLACGNGHCVVIAGYDGDTWIIKNSWGSGWGDHGYATVPFDESNWTVSVAWMGGVYYDE
ncbi:MAG: hypothetical protein APR53_10340 [Methanoculleus sp. SDB]|nr:MAG: hypothetical protein APR53_10340 [Methanoculleus sp. SDB]